jgi:hypothetical protein
MACCHTSQKHAGLREVRPRSGLVPPLTLCCHMYRGVCVDLNPNNVLLKKDANEPSGFAAKVGDFGLSVMLPQHQSHLSNIRMGTMVRASAGEVLLFTRQSCSGIPASW